VLLACATLVAQQMPDPSEMAGRPLPAPELPSGTVSVRLVRERMGNNIVNHPVALVPGEAAKRAATTDAQGRAQFDGLAPGTMVTVEATVDGEALRSQAFPVPATGGVRVALVAGLEAARARERAAAEEAARQPARPGAVVFGGETRIILEFQDDSLQVFYLLDIVNAARTPIDTGQPLVIELPEGAGGASTMQGSSPLATAAGDRVRITGPFPPGTTSVQLGFRMRYNGDRITIAQRWPAAIERLFVGVEKVGNLQIASPQFRSQEEARAGETPFIVATGARVDAGDTLTLTLNGLPHRSTLFRDVGLVAGLATLLAGLAAAVRGAPARRGREAQLVRRKERLFADLMALEDERGCGRVDEHRYAARRRALVSELERVMGELDRGPAGGGADLAA
jgi:hypothetical protein